MHYFSSISLLACIEGVSHDGHVRLSPLLADVNNTSINSFYIHYSEQIHA